MPADYDLIPKQPLEALNKALSIDLKGVGLSLAKLVMFYATSDAKDMGEAAIDAFQAVSIKDKTTTSEQAAWVLIFNAFGRSFYALIHEYKDLLMNKDLAELQLEDLAAWFSHRLNQVEIQLDVSFFKNPEDIALFENAKPALIGWLGQFKFDQVEAEAFYLRLKRRFVLELHEEWGKNAGQYQELLQRLDTPFTAGAQQERDWAKYRAHLINEADARVFGEAFGLRQIYIPLRAYVEEKISSEERELEHKEEVKKTVCDLHTTIHAWVRQFDKEQPLKLISGGPGCGKSSFAKVLAAELSEQYPELTAVFIPLHHFRLDNDFIESLSAFVRDERYLKTNPLHCDTRHNRVLLILDGLDELAMQGKAAAESAQYFMEQISSLLNRHNDQGRTWQALITGRELAIQNAHQRHKARQVLHVLPYLLKEGESQAYEDVQGLLSADQRQLWWKKFGSLKGKGYQGLPEELDTEHLLPITREPLLNYLIALSYERQEIEFNAQTNLNIIYEDLLTAVFERSYAGKRRHLGAKDLSQGDFLKILEEVALAVWHGNGRTASINYLKKRFEENQFTRRLLDKFQEDAQKGVVRLLTAFYFRQAGKDENHDPTFEFTHKSFGEYLTAKKIVREVIAINKRYQNYLEEPEEHNSISKLLETWLKLTGITALDEHIAKFIVNELAQQPLEKLKQYQETFTRLLEYAINQGTPVDKLGLTSFYKMLEHSRNSEEALLVICSACAMQTDNLTSINWAKPNSFGTWIRRMQGQRMGAENNLFAYHCIKINLSGQRLDYCDLYGYVFRHSNLENTAFFGCTLISTNLRHANLVKSILTKSDLTGADLTGADLGEADLRGSDLIRANLTGANLRRADLIGADLRFADLTGADLRGTDLRGTDLRGTDLRGTDLRGTDLREADLSDTIYEGKDLAEITK